MSILRRHGVSLTRRAIGTALLVVLTGTLAAALFHRQFYDPPLKNGYYKSQGQILLADGRLIEATHLLRITGQHFHAVTRQGDTVLEHSGTISTRGGVYLLVDSGSVQQLSGTLDDDMIFGMLYGQRSGARIQLIRRGPCLYALETGQIFCPVVEAR
ncbi:hypothetical protein [Parazoarcus communis]|uniref:hypothetical protein n=1 Tax=Parazoarcus communis TaxID=41977 RepID=UPI0010576A83|nr:hypothetical protein [Parazoarcus communis]NMG69076.1 hypothetical protein [Parazoarcus communis SWub3 = DSM 12120]